jgi:hypothetical protein
MKTGIIFRTTLIGLIIFILGMPCFSQSDSLTIRKDVSSNLKIAYNSSLIYPGIRAGIEFPVYFVSLKKTIDSENVKSILKGRFISINAGWYHHPDFHDNLYLTAEWTMRRAKGNGFFTEFSSGLGYSRTFLGATTYQVDVLGNVKIIKSAGYNYALIVAGGGLGYDFSNKKEIPLSVFYKFDIIGMFPYNSTIYFRPIMELGIIYKPLYFMRLSTKTRNILK